MAKSNRTEAEERYAKAQKRARDAAKAMTEAELEAKRVDENTARLRALRLAKEAKDAAEAAANPPKSKAKKKPAAKKPAAARKPAAAKKPAAEKTVRRAKSA